MFINYLRLISLDFLASIFGGLSMTAAAKDQAHHQSSKQIIVVT
jgi:hypothetical protein